MGDVVEMKRKVIAQVVRFGQTFRVEFQAGRAPESSDPQAALYLNGTLLAWLAVSFPTGHWDEVFFDLDEDHHLIDPSMVGMSATTEDLTDLKFLLEAEEYVLALLGDALATRLTAIAGPLPEKEDSDDIPDLRNTHPRERGRRVATVWHDHGRVEEQLPDLVAIEIYDALEGMGASLAKVMEEVGSPGAGQAILDLVERSLQEWHGDEG